MTFVYILLGVAAYLAIAAGITRMRVKMINRGWYWSTWMVLVNLNMLNSGTSNYERVQGRANAPGWGLVWPVVAILELVGALVVSVIGTFAFLLITVFVALTGAVLLVKKLARV
jgi:hypothetical protein